MDGNKRRYNENKINMKETEKENMEKKIKDILAFNLIEVIKKDESVVNCDDNICDNEDCVLYRALKQYMKYEFDLANNKSISFETLIPEE